tara:strand:+ start:3552 stop:4244 length:693 start_codon:yes stop_codon:yes gene_type:complete
MKAVLLAAGEGTRLRPLTLTIPKCLVPINGKALLDYWLEMLSPCDEIDEIFINVSYLKRQVIEHINTNWSHCNKITIWHEQKLLGTAGTLKANYNVIKNDDVIVIHADNLSQFSLSNFIACYHQRSKNIEVCMMLFETDSPKLCGIVELDKNGVVTAMHEKIEMPPSNLANGAVYIFSPNVMRQISNSHVTDISNHVIPNFLGEIIGWKNTDYHRDIGTPISYEKAQSMS